MFFSLNKNIIYTVSHFVCGGVAGCLSSTVAQPLDVIRTRLVAQGEPKVWLSLWIIFPHIDTMNSNVGLEKVLVSWFTNWKSWIPFIIVLNDHWNNKLFWWTMQHGHFGTLLFFFYVQGHTGGDNIPCFSQRVGNTGSGVLW